MTDLGLAGLFREVDPKELQALRSIAEERLFPAGTRIFSENEPGDGVYVIQDGLVEIAHLVGDQAQCVFSKIGPGEIFGEMAVIEDRPRSATTTAVKETRVYFIPRDQMVALLRRSPALSLKLLQEVSSRLRDFNHQHLREIVEAERLSALGTFARSIVHDLKNPLTVIGMATEIMAAPQASLERRQEAYERVKRQIAAITELVGDILDFTQSLPVDRDFTAVSYREFIQELVRELGHELELKGSLLNVENEPPPGVLRFDPRRIRRVILNLTGNAIEMMPEGGRITMRFQQGGNEMITEIEDEGPGIAPEVAAKLFQPFVTFGKPHGTGLGLSICKRIIEDHGGRISAHNAAAPAHGAIFSFTLPMRGTPEH
ncbi:MAG TPA: ATP-binding protein [Alphaproteobacteria bacterium]|nr:ATP-binding protein [Alphaproteobacteria bacterium]